MQIEPGVTAAYEGALPEDPRVQRKKMFGMPCAFVNRQMFFGTFGDSVVARVGPKRAQELAKTPGMQIFTPMEGRQWNDYVQLPATAHADTLRALAAEAMAWTDLLPPKAEKPPAARANRKK